MKLNYFDGGARSNFRRTATLLLALSCFLQLAPLTPGAAMGRGEKLLNLRYHRQHTQVWCWAASIAMVVEYIKGERIEDCEVLSLYDRQFGGPGRCCQGDTRCVRGSMPGEIGPILGNIFGVRGQVLNRGLSWQEVVANIDNDRPIIAWVWNSPTSAHVVVIVGYRDPGIIMIFDPLTGPKELPHNAFATNWGPSHNWNISWVFSSGPNRTPGGGRGGGPQWRTVIDPCTHRAHPAGDVGPCGHGVLHPAGDVYPCGHVCYDTYGRPYPCHPAGDLFPCSHPVHPAGDVYPCGHLLHPAGHERRVQVN